MNTRSPAIVYLFLILSSAVHAQKKSAAAPDFIVIQYAGSIGYLSAGTGYDVFKSKGRASVHFGSVPKARGGLLNVITGKVFYEPWNTRISDRLWLNPADIGLMASYHMGENFRKNVPDLLNGDNYYWWHTSLRIHLAMETALSIEMEPNRFFSKVTVYSELNTNDLYLVSFFKNASSLSGSEMIKAGIGVRFNF